MWKSLRSKARPKSNLNLFKPGHSNDAVEFENLPTDVLVAIYHILDLNDAIILSESCRKLSNLYIEFNIHQVKTKERFRVDIKYHSLRLQTEVLENNWAKFYRRLDRLETGFRGLAFDPATSEFEPYPMELIFQQTEFFFEGIPNDLLTEIVGQQDLMAQVRLELGGICKWKTLRDSMTGVFLYNRFRELLLTALEFDFKKILGLEGHF